MVFGKSLIHLIFKRFKSYRIVRLILISIFLTFFFQSKSQDLCLQTSYATGNFDLSKSTLCLPQLLTVADKSGGSNIRYVFDYEGESLEEVMSVATSQTTFDYSSLAKKPETFTVLQIGELNGKVSIACKNLVVRPGNAVIHSFTQCGASNLVVNIPVNTLNDFDNYQVIVGTNTTNVSPSQLPYQGTQNVILPAQLKVVGSYNNPLKGCSSIVSSTTVTPLGLVIGGVDRPFNPNISELKLLSLNKATFTFTGAYHESNLKQEQYHLYVYPKGNMPKLSDTISSNIKPGKYTIDIINSTQSYCFYVQRMRTACGLSVENSSELCTIPLKSVTFTPYQYKLDWLRHEDKLFGLPRTASDYIVVDQQQIERSENSVPINPLVMIQPNIFTYDDNAINCKNRYCYRIKVNTSGQVGFLKFAGQSSSNLICVDRSAIMADKPSDVFVSTDFDNRNAVFFSKSPTWPVDVNRWILYKKDNNGFKKADSLVHPVDFVKDKVLVTKSEEYKIGYVDKCESLSVLSDSVASVFMTYQEPDLLNWKNDNPFAESIVSSQGVEYIEENSNNIKALRLEIGNQHIADFDGYDDQAKFRLKSVSNSSPPLVSYSNVVKAEVPTNLVLPNAFTPNGDNNNDLFGLKGKSANIQSFSLQVYNRYGEKMVEFSSPNEGWDGKINGKNAPAGTYFFKISAIIKNGERITKEGILDLIR
jgi:gliding motility-associated-like protein